MTELDADLVGRAIHEAKVVGGPWGPACVRRMTEHEFETVPYGYDGGEFECECPSMGRHLVSLIAAAEQSP